MFEVLQGISGFLRGRPCHLSFVRAVPWPFLICIVALFCGYELETSRFHLWQHGTNLDAIVWLFWEVGWLGIALFAMADAVSRHREYQRIKLMLVKFGYSERILEPLARSRCQRDAAIGAANEVGYGRMARAYFVGLGYRWYHILPDLVVKKPLILFRPSVVCSLFLPGKKARLS